MASIPLEYASGTQTATISTEHILLDNTTQPGVFVFNVDVSNMVSGDTLELRVYRKVPVSDSLRVMYFTSLSDAQGADYYIVCSVPCETPINGEIKFTLKQTAGTGRSFGWSVDQL